MAKLPKFPKGLKASINKLKRKEEQKKKVLARKKEIETMKKLRDSLRKKLY
jgi:hypothetical protein